MLIVTPLFEERLNRVKRKKIRQSINSNNYVNVTFVDDIEDNKEKDTTKKKKINIKKEKEKEKKIKNNADIS